MWAISDGRALGEQGKRKKNSFVDSSPSVHFSFAIRSPVRRSPSVSLLPFRTGVNSLYLFLFPSQIGWEKLSIFYFRVNDVRHV